MSSSATNSASSPSTAQEAPDSQNAPENEGRAGALAMLPLAPQHAARAAALHIAGQPNTFLTRLGPEVLAVIYAALPATRAGFGFVAVEQDPETQQPEQDPEAILGFISATTGVGELFVEIGVQRLPRLLLLLLRRVLRRPGLLWQSVQTLVYPWMAGGEYDVPAAELLSIMVTQQARRQGIGARLLGALIDECVLRGLSQLDVTVDASNDGAQRFYLRHSFAHHRRFKLYGRPMVQLRRQLYGETDDRAIDNRVDDPAANHSPDTPL